MTINESMVCCYEHTGPHGEQGVVVKGLRIVNEKEEWFCSICEMQNEQDNINDQFQELTPEDFIEFLRQRGFIKVEPKESNGKEEGNAPFT